jgi:hypothetical protein
MRALYVAAQQTACDEVMMMFREICIRPVVSCYGYRNSYISQVFPSSLFLSFEPFSRSCCIHDDNDDDELLLPPPPPLLELVQLSQYSD